MEAVLSIFFIVVGTVFIFMEGFKYSLLAIEKQKEIRSNEDLLQQIATLRDFMKEGLDSCGKKCSEIDEVRKRVDTLTLRAGFKL